MTSLTASEYSANQQPYAKAGLERATNLDNRGPARFTDEGKLTPDILEAFWRTGFYVFEGLIDQAEIQLLRDDMSDLLDHAPIDNGATLDHLSLIHI